MSSSAVISVVGLSKVFRDFWHRARVRAVSNLDFHVEPGEIYGLLGPNGSGKSTTIKMLLGLLYPSRGRIAVFGKPPEDVAVKRRIGYLPEESYLYRFLNARETLDYYATLFQLPRRDRRRRIDELLDMVGLRAAARRPVGEYSKGMARRIGLAQALINDPDLLILDEPTSGLDPVGTKLVKDIILRLGSEYRKTILLSSHLLADVEEVCGRVTILYGGQVQVSGPMEDVLSRRGELQFSSPRLSDETVAELQRVVAQREGKQLVVTIPRDRLEALFLRIVEQAHAQKLETAGAGQAGAIAGFLGGTPEGRAILDSLVRPEPVAESAMETGSDDPEQGAAAAAALQQLVAGPTADAPQADARTTPATGGAASRPKRSSGDADRGVLDELLGGADKERS